jgi:hypothetical protein
MIEIIEELHNSGKITGIEMVELVGNPLALEKFKIDKFYYWDEAERRVLNRISLIESLKAGVE